MPRKHKLNKVYRFERIAKDILKKRTTEGLDLRRAGEEAGVNYATLQRMEAGQPNPNIENVVNVCNWLGKEIQEYF